MRIGEVTPGCRAAPKLRLWSQLDADSGLPGRQVELEVMRKMLRCLNRQQVLAGFEPARADTQRTAGGNEDIVNENACVCRLRRDSQS